MYFSSILYLCNNLKLGLKKAYLIQNLLFSFITFMNLPNGRNRSKLVFALKEYCEKTQEESKVFYKRRQTSAQ